MEHIKLQKTSFLPLILLVKALVSFRMVTSITLPQKTILQTVELNIL